MAPHCEQMPARRQLSRSDGFLRLGIVSPHEVPTRWRNDADPITILFFGTVRPYKGLEDLVDAFDLLCESEEGRWQLFVVGEPWENWTLPLDKIARSVHRDAIGLVDRYVRDDELASFFGRADLVALPYVESAASGPLHLTMATGLPVVVTEVGGLVSVAADYKGGVLVPPPNPEALALGIEAAAELAGHRHEDPHSWERTNASLRRTFDNL